MFVRSSGLCALLVGSWLQVGMAAEPFVRGDVDGDGRRTLADAVRLLHAVVEREDLPCPDAADVTDNGLVQLGDAAHLLEYLLKGAPAPKPPYPSAGADPTSDGLGCESVGPAPGSAEGAATYSLSVLPALGGRPGFRLRVEVASTVALFGGRLAIRLPEAWGLDSRVLEVRPSLELSTSLREDSVTAALVLGDGRLRCQWLLSQSDFATEFPAEVATRLLDITLCPGSTPAGSYALEAEETEAVTADGLEVPSSMEPFSLAWSDGPVECPEPLEEPASMRAYMWLTDARVEPGETFRVSLYATASFSSLDHRYFLRWDPTVLRAAWAETTAQSGARVVGGIQNVDEPANADVWYAVTQPLPASLIPFNGLLSLCYPCVGFSEPIAVVTLIAGATGVRPRVPWPADEEFHHLDMVFQVVLDAPAGATEVELVHKPTGTVANGIRGYLADGVVLNVPWFVPRPRLPARIEIVPPSGRRLFLRGDANDDGTLDLSDAVGMLQSLFGGAPPTTCEDAADANDDGRLDVSDPIYALGYLFLGGRIILPPYPFRGTDWSEDSLRCE